MNRTFMMFLDLLFYICTIWCLMVGGAWAHYLCADNTTTGSLLVYVGWLVLGGLFFAGARITYHILEKDVE